MILSHGGTVFSNEALQTYLDRDVEGSLLGTFLKIELNNRVVAIENSSETEYESECMRKLILDLVDLTLGRSGNKIYTADIFQRTKELQKLNAKKRQINLDNLVKLNKGKFNAAYDCAMRGATGFAMDAFKGKTFSDLLRACERNYSEEKSVLEPELRRYVTGESVELYCQMEGLSNDDDCPFMAIIEECLVVGMLQRAQVLAQQENDTTAEHKYKAFQKVYQFGKTSSISVEGIMRKLSDDEKDSITEAERQEHVEKAARFAQRKAGFLTSIEDILREGDTAIWEELKSYVRGMTYSEWRNMGRPEYEIIARRVQEKISPDARKYWQEDELIQQVQHQAENKSDQLKTMITFLFNKFKSVAGDFFGRIGSFCTIL